MKFLLTVLLIITSLYTMSQESVRYYEEGDLTFDDFRGTPLNDTLISQIFTDMAYASKRKRVKDSILFIAETKNMMYKNASWIRESERSEYNLIYNQVIFNFFELKRRSFQAWLNGRDDFSKSEEAMQAFYMDAQLQALEFVKKAKGGADSNFVRTELTRTESELKSTPLNYLPSIERRNFKAGIFIGYSHAFADSKLSNYFNPNAGLTLGFEFFLKRYTLNLGISLFNSKVVNEFNRGKELWQKGQRVDIDYGNFGFGYVILDKKKSKITPFIGLSSYTINNEKAEYSFDDYDFAYGFNFDYKFLKSVNFVAVPYRETIEHYIKLRVSITQIDHKPIEGNLINVMIGYGYVIGGQKLKKPISK